MYLIQIDHLVYEKKGGDSFTLGEAWRELVGVGNCAILRIQPDGTTTTIAYRPGYNGTWRAGDGDVLRRSWGWPTRTGRKGARLNRSAEYLRSRAA